MFYSVLESGNHVIVIVTSDLSLLLIVFCLCCFYHRCVNYSKLFKLFVIMNWKDDQLKKLILFQISGTRNPATGTRNWYQFSGTSFWSVCHGH